MNDNMKKNTNRPITFGEKLVIFKVNRQIAKKNYKKANEIICKFLKKHKNSEVVHEKLAKLYELEGGTRKAIEQYAKVLELNSTNYDAFMRIIELMEFLDKKEETIELIKKLLTVYKTNYRAYEIYGYLLEEDLNLKEAVKVYEEGVLNNPTSEVLLYNLASVYISLNEYKEAKNNLEKIYELNKKDIVTILNLAQISLIENELTLAQFYLEQALLLKKIDDIVYYEFAKISILKEDEKAALEYLNKALELNSSIITKINNTRIFDSIKEETVVKIDLVQKEKVVLPNRCVDVINMLEEDIEKMIMLKINEKEQNIKNYVNNIIKKMDENINYEKEQDNIEKTNEFIKNHIENNNDNDNNISNIWQ